jgi:hypothetical protein
VTGWTHQLRAISFEADEDGRPRSFATVLWSRCPGTRPQRTDWTPADGNPVPFGGIKGRMRSVWRFARDGREYAVCDSGAVAFAATRRR